MEKYNNKLSIEEYISKLSILDKDENDYVDKFEIILSEIISLRDIRSIRILVNFLDDDSDYPGLMYSIIQTIEIFDSNVYLQEILKELPKFYQQSPKRASLIFKRALNSTPGLETLLNLSNIQNENMKNFSVMLKKIAEENPEFTERVILILEKE